MQQSGGKSVPISRTCLASSGSCCNFVRRQRLESNGNFGKMAAGKMMIKQQDAEQS